MKLKNLFITGASGFVGRAVLARIVELNEYGRIYLLIRPSATMSADKRVDDLVERLFPPEKFADVRDRIQAVAGDLTSPSLGLSTEDRATVVRYVNQFLHVGASTDFGAPIEESRLYNVAGTRYVLELAAECQAGGNLQRFEYVSTAYVAGIKSGRVREDDLDRGQEFANNYERSKFEAETLVRSYMQRFPICIYRPSIVVGDSRHGFTPHFKVLYWPLRLLAKNLLNFIPVNRFARLDVVPVDYVADAIVALI